MDSCNDLNWETETNLHPKQLGAQISPLDSWLFQSRNTVPRWGRGCELPLLWTIFKVSYPPGIFFRD